MNSAGIDQQTVSVAITTTARMIDTSNGVVLKRSPASGDSSTTQTVASGVGYNPNGTDFGSSVAGVATFKAIDALVAGIEPPKTGATASASSGPSDAPSTPTPAAASNAPIVADVSGNTLILTVGTAGGIKVGDTVDIARPGRIIKNPQTGEVIKVIMTQVGKAKITEADARSATAIFTGDGNPQVNDQVSIPAK